MITAASLRNHTSKDLAQMARKKGIQGWHSMRKDELVKALLRAARKKSRAKNGAKTNGSSARQSSRNGSSPAKKSPPIKQTPTRVLRRIRKANAEREHFKDLSQSPNGKKNGAPLRDRAVLMVRDSYWLHVFWEVTRQRIERVRAAMAEHWHTAKPTLRLYELDNVGTTNIADRVVRDIEIHGGVNNWYLDVQDPPQHYRVAIGYLGANGRFCALVNSNSVQTPAPGSSDTIDQNWTDVAENYEKVYAMSGGYSDESCGELRELFEERLRRPMGSPVVTKFGAGAEGLAHREQSLGFEVDAEMIIYGTTHPESYVTLGGEPIRLRPDGTFTVRMHMPDRRQVIPVVASSHDGVEQRTVVLAIERNTKVMEPQIRDPNE